MELMAWFSHKYIMHGFLWVLHKDHHKKDHKSWFERNDLFFFFYAFLSASFVVMWGQGFWLGLPIAIGIGLYGLAYFIVHDVFIHQRFKFLRNVDNKYARGVRRAHKIHHKNINKEILKIVDIRYGKPYEEETTKSCDDFIFKLIPGSKDEIKKIAESGIY